MKKIHQCRQVIWAIVLTFNMYEAVFDRLKRTVCVRDATFQHLPISTAHNKTATHFQLGQTTGASFLCRILFGNGKSEAEGN